MPRLFGKLAKDVGAPVRMQPAQDGRRTVHRHELDQLGRLVEVRLVEDLDRCRYGHRLQHARSHAAFQTVQRLGRIGGTIGDQRLGQHEGFSSERAGRHKVFLDGIGHGSPRLSPSRATG
jgi:hypothetical protein